VWAYVDYVDALEAASHRRLPVGRDAHRYVNVVLGEYPTNMFPTLVSAEYPAGIMFSTLVTAEWQFDESDALTNIVVERHYIGP
jgi:hypothetical protein